jgi:hypothetical protein
MAGSLVLYAGKSRSSHILVPAYGEASSKSGSESKVHSYSGSGTGTESSSGMSLNAEGIPGYYVLCLVTNTTFKYGVTLSRYVTITLPVHA